MTLRTMKRWLALWLALAFLAPAALSEAVDFGDVAEEVVSEPAEETVAEIEGFVLSNLADDEGDGDSAEPTSSESGEASGDEAIQPSEEPDAGEQSEQASEALNRTALKLGIDESYTLKLQSGASFDSIGARFESSKPKVASVNATTGKITARKKGSATITMTTQSGEVATCEVKVLKAPSKVTISRSKLTLGVGEEATLTAKLPDKTASASIAFSSSDSKVVAVDADGHIVALKKGTAKITVKTFNKKKATCKVTVKAAPRKVSFGESVISIWQGESYNAKPRLSNNSAGAYSLTSSNESAVSISGTTLKGVSPGTSIITVTTYNGLTAELSVEVCRKPVYRALLIGETTFPDAVSRMPDLPGKKDVTIMKRILKNTKGATKGKWSVTSRFDRTSTQIHSDIQEAFNGAQEGDVSLFYISTHGDQEQSFDGNWPEYAGYLRTYPDMAYSDWFDRNALTLVCLAEWLKAVPGQVIVIIDSCGSGAAIYGAKGNAASDYSPEIFGDAVVNAFEAQDEDIMAPGMDEGAFVVQNKFFVLTSAGYQETCFTNDNRYSYFTKWLTEGIGEKGRMPADSNKDKLTTLNELYKYIKKQGNSVVKVINGVKYKQHVQVYPSGSSFGLFYRK